MSYAVELQVTDW